jgi:hypothetical protein
MWYENWQTKWVLLGQKGEFEVKADGMTVSSTAKASKNARYAFQPFNTMFNMNILGSS